MLKPLSLRWPTRTTAIPTEYFILANLRADGPVVGHLAGLPIREAVIDHDGQRYRFSGVMPCTRSGRFAVENLRPGEWIVRPGLIYTLEERKALTA